MVSLYIVIIGVLIMMLVLRCWPLESWKTIVPVVDIIV